MPTQKASATNPLTSLSNALQSQPWLKSVLTIGLGGSAFTIAGLYLLHWLLEFYEDSGLIDPHAKSSALLTMCFVSVALIFRPAMKAMTTPSPSNNIDLKVLGVVLFTLLCVSLIHPVPANVLALGVAFLVMSLVAYFSLFLIYPSRRTRTAAVSLWCFSYMALWMAGAANPISLPMFVIFWIAVGFGGGLLIHSINGVASAKERQHSDSLRRRGEDQQAQAEGLAKTRRRAGRTSGARSQFGRIPQDTVDLFSNHVRRVTGPITAALPISTSVLCRNITVSIILGILYRDWRENDNFAALTPQDIEDLQSFVEMAADLSGSEESAVDLAIFRVSLNALAQDWLANWNETNNSGPPDRIY